MNRYCRFCHESGPQIFCDICGINICCSCVVVCDHCENFCCPGHCGICAKCKECHCEEDACVEGIKCSFCEDFMCNEGTKCSICGNLLCKNCTETCICMNIRKICRNKHKKVKLFCEICENLICNLCKLFCQICEKRICEYCSKGSCSLCGLVVCLCCSFCHTMGEICSSCSLVIFQKESDEQLYKNYVKQFLENPFLF